MKAVTCISSFAVTLLTISSLVVAILTTSGAHALELDQLQKIFSPCGKAEKIAPGQNIGCKDALPHIQNAIDNFGLNTPQLVAFYLSYIGFESGNLSYVRNAFPGNPGHGSKFVSLVETSTHTQLPFFKPAP
jgi:hypothetical protein